MNPIKHADLDIYKTIRDRHPHVLTCIRQDDDVDTRRLWNLDPDAINSVIIASGLHGTPGVIYRDPDYIIIGLSGYE